MGTTTGTGCVATEYGLGSKCTDHSLCRFRTYYIDRHPVMETPREATETPREVMETPREAMEMPREATESLGQRSRSRRSPVSPTEATESLRQRSRSPLSECLLYMYISDFLSV